MIFIPNNCLPEYIRHFQKNVQAGGYFFKYYFEVVVQITYSVKILINLTLEGLKSVHDNSVSLMKIMIISSVASHTNLSRETRISRKSRLKIFASHFSFHYM